MSRYYLCQASRTMVLFAKLGGFTLQFSGHTCHKWFTIKNGCCHRCFYSNWPYWCSMIFIISHPLNHLQGFSQVTACLFSARLRRALLKKSLPSTDPGKRSPCQSDWLQFHVIAQTCKL